MRQAIKADLQAADAHREQTRSEARALKERLSHLKVEKIDEEVARIEHQLQHTSALNESNKCPLSRLCLNPFH